MPSISYDTESFYICIENSWSTNAAIGISGYAFHKSPGENLDLSIDIDGTTVKINQWYPRLDIHSQFKQYNPPLNSGFQLRIDRTVTHTLSISCNDSKFKLAFPGHTPPSKDDHFSDALLAEFFNRLNLPGKNILELGSRKSLPEPIFRSQFTNIATYIGFDIYKGHDVDVVGDAHLLSTYFDAESFDGILSTAVFEHLAMPWKVVMEMNSVLKLGGLVFILAPVAWPLHEMPWDFWRFSHASLNVLFSKPFGFRVLNHNYNKQLHMYLDEHYSGQENFSLTPSFGEVGILAEKIGEIDARIRWDIGLGDVLEPDSSYPEP